MTNVYSVSFPVCSVWSHWSNISEMWQTKQIARISVAVMNEALDLIF